MNAVDVLPLRHTQITTHPIGANLATINVFRRLWTTMLETRTIEESATTPPPLNKTEITTLAKKHFNDGRLLRSKNATDSDKKTALTKEFDTLAKIIRERTPDAETKAIGKAALIDSEILTIIDQELTALIESKHSRSTRLKMLDSFPYTSLLVKFQAFRENPEIGAALLRISNVLNTEKSRLETPSIHRRKGEELSANTHIKLKPKLEIKRDEADTEVDDLIKYIEEQKAAYYHRGQRDKKGRPATFITTFSSHTHGEDHPTPPIDGLEF